MQNYVVAFIVPAGTNWTPIEAKIICGDTTVLGSNLELQDELSYTDQEEPTQGKVYKTTFFWQYSVDFTLNVLLEKNEETITLVADFDNTGTDRDYLVDRYNSAGIEFPFSGRVQASELRLDESEIKVQVGDNLHGLIEELLAIAETAAHCDITWVTMYGVPVSS